MFTICKPSKELPTEVWFSFGGEEYHPAKKNPFVPAGRALRIFRWPIGSDMCDDPEKAFADRDIDSPIPMVHEAASWYRTLRAALGSLGVSLKNPFLILLLLVVALAALGGGYIIGNVDPIHPP